VTNVPFLHAGNKIINDDGTPVEWFRNAWNSMVDRNGGEAFNALEGVINGATEQTARLAAETAARIAGDAAAQGSNSGTGVSNSTSYSGGVSAGATWTTIGTVVVTPSGAGGDYTVTITPDTAISGHLDDEGAVDTTFTGAWRVVEELTGGGTEYVLATGVLGVTYTAPQEYGSISGETLYTAATWVVGMDSLPTTLLAANNSAQSDIRLEIQRTSGTNEITAPGLSGTISVTWTA